MWRHVYDHYGDVCSAMPATRARERLQRMTGSDSVQLIDANYMTMLSKKYWEEYEVTLALTSYTA